MTRFIFFFLSLFVSAVSVAQQSNYDKAVVALAVGDFGEAISLVEKDCAGSDAKKNASTWYNAGFVYASVLHNSQQFNAKYAERAVECAQKCRSFPGGGEIRLEHIYFYAGETYYRQCERYLNNHDYKNAFECATRAAEFFLAGEKFVNAAEANNLLAVCKLGVASSGASTTEEQCRYLKEAVKFLETSTELSKGRDNSGVIEDNNAYLFNYAGNALYSTAEAYFQAGQYKKALDCAHNAVISFDYSGDVAMKEKTQQMITMCEKAARPASSPEVGSLPTTKVEPVAAQPQTTEARSDVDENIPVSGVRNENTYVFIIANEDYPNRHVPYALNDGRTFKEYCYSTLGIPTNRIRMYENATAGNLIACVANIKRASEANDGDLNIILYYAGHAFPDEESKDAYLMPVDGDSRLVETCFSLKRLYKELGGIKTNQAVCFLDACFSGATREDDMLLSGRGVAIKPKEETPQGNLVVFTSASGAETAHQYEEKRHGLFTYYLLKKMQESNGNFTLGELFDNVRKNVKKTSYDVNERIQTPTVIPSTTMEQKWRNIKL